MQPAEGPPARTGMKAFKVLGSRFELPEHYEIIDPVGSGAYGVVVAAKDNSLPETDGATNLAFNCSLDKYGFFRSELQ